MPYFKDTNGGLHFLDSADFAHLLPTGCLEITDAEAKQIKAPTVAQLIVGYAEAIQARLDDFARTRNYDGILSATTYATSAVPKFAAEGQYALAARDATWAAGYQILAAVESGQRPAPTLAELAAELPPLAWPL